MTADLIETRIATLGQRGEGVTEIDDEKIYVPFTLPGEEVEITVDGDRGTLVSLLTHSPHRIEPFCPHFGLCGGCQIQHLDRASYEGFKVGLLQTALARAGIQTPIAPLLDAQGNGRRRATLHAQKSGAGFMAARSHALHDIDLCPILVPALARAPAIARAAYAALGDCNVALTASLTGLDVAIHTEKNTRPERLPPIAQRFTLARL